MKKNSNKRSFEDLQLWFHSGLQLPGAYNLRLSEACCLFLRLTRGLPKTCQEVSETVLRNEHL